MEYSIDNVWGVRARMREGGLGINWSSSSHSGELVLYVDNEHTLHAETEGYASPENKEFIQKILNLLIDEIIVDE